MKTIYHIFSNNHDDWVTNYKKALLIAKDWFNDYGCVRIYKEYYNPNTDEPIEEDCLYSKGGYPF